VIGPLLAMAFSPNPTMRYWCNRRKTRYQGVQLNEGICISFTHMVFPSDIQALSQFREVLSKALSPDFISQNLADEIRPLLYQILMKPRKPVKLKDQTQEEKTRPMHQDPPLPGNLSGIILLPPIIPRGDQILVKVREDEDYDSEEEFVGQKRKVIEAIRNRFATAEAKIPDSILICAMYVALLFVCLCLFKCCFFLFRTFFLEFFLSFWNSLFLSFFLEFFLSVILSGILSFFLSLFLACLYLGVLKCCAN